MENPGVAIEQQTSMMQAQLVAKLAGLCDLMATSNHVDPAKLASVPAAPARTPLGDRTNTPRGAAVAISEKKQPTLLSEKKQPILRRQNEVRNFSPWYSESEPSRKSAENMQKVNLGVAAQKLRDQRTRSWDSASYSSLGSISRCSSRTTLEIPSQRWRRPAPGERCPGTTPWRCGRSKRAQSPDLEGADASRSVSTTRIWEPWDSSHLVTEDSGLETTAELRRDRLREGASRPSTRTVHGIFAATLRDSIEDRSSSWGRSHSWDSTIEAQRTESQTRQRNARERSRQSSLDPKEADAFLQASCCDGKQAEDARTSRRYMELRGYEMERSNDQSLGCESCLSSNASRPSLILNRGLQTSRASLSMSSSNSASQITSRITQDRDRSRIRPHSANARSWRSTTEIAPKQMMSVGSRDRMGSAPRQMMSKGSRERVLSADNRGRKQISVHSRSPSQRSLSPQGFSRYGSTSSLISPRTSLPRSVRPSSRQVTPLKALNRNASARRLVPWAQSECRQEITRLREELHRATERLCAATAL